MFDIEANHLEPEKVTTVWCVVIKDLQTEEVFKYGPEDIPRAIEKLNDYDYIVGHNIISYDIPVLRYLHGFNPRGKVIDTLVLSRLANPDRKPPWGWKGPWAPHSIEVWGARIGKPKVEWDVWDKWDEGMLHRCEQDVLINEAVFKALYYEFKE